MKRQLQNKLYTFIIIAMMFSAAVNAQIVYTDVNSDTTITTGIPDGLYTYNLDLNNDGTVDFKISAVRAHNWMTGALSLYVVVTPLNTNAVLDSLSGSVYYPVALGLNSYLGTDSVWRHTSNQILRRENAGSYNSGFWSCNTDSFLGLKLIVASDTSYGWVRLSIQKNGTGNNEAISFTIKDYAYNSIPNQSILTGDTGLVPSGIIENIASSIILYPNPATNNFNITFGSIDKLVEITITDFTGKIIYRITVFDPDIYREQKIEVITKDFAEGIYLVRIQTSEFSKTDGLIVTK